MVNAGNKLKVPTMTNIESELVFFLVAAHVGCRGWRAIKRVAVVSH